MTPPSCASTGTASTAETATVAMEPIRAEPATRSGEVASPDAHVASGHRHQDPRHGVDHDQGAGTEDRAEHGEQPDDVRIHAGVLGEPAADSAEPLVVAAAGKSLAQRWRDRGWSGRRAGRR